MKKTVRTVEIIIESRERMVLKRRRRIIDQNAAINPECTSDLPLEASTNDMEVKNEESDCKD